VTLGGAWSPKTLLMAPAGCCVSLCACGVQVRPSHWSEFELGAAAVYWETATGRPASSVRALMEEPKHRRAPSTKDADLPVPLSRARCRLFCF